MDVDEKLLAIERKVDELDRLLRQVLTTAQAANQAAIRAESAARFRN